MNIGQNIAAANHEINWNQSVISWHSEIIDFKYGESTDKMVGHYTQVIPIFCFVMHFLTYSLS